MTGFDPNEFADRAALRAELGYGADEKICIVSVGGSGVGADLLRRVTDAAPYVPLRNHIEQNLHVRARLDRYGAGLYLDYADFHPDHVASLISSQLTTAPAPRDVESTGAATAAALIAELL